MTLPVVFTANGQAGYNLTKSLRFRSSASAYLNRTPAGSPTSTQKFTQSYWVKRGTLGTYQYIYNCEPSDWVRAYIFSDDLFYFDIRVSGTNYSVATTQVFRDPSAWYHIVVSVDTTQATAANRVIIYVNGVQAPTNTPTIPQNSATVANSANPNFIGAYKTPNQYFDGYLAEVNFIDGQALTPSSFGQTSTTTGVWIPKKYSGSYGTNGFYLPFTDTTSTSTLGTDFSGNSNTWTVNNISLTAGSTYDSMTDVPTLTSATTANYCVLNPLVPVYANSISYANMRFSNSQASAWATANSTLGVSSGKWYWEATITTLGSAAIIGISNSDTIHGATALGQLSNDYAYLWNGNKQGNAGSATSYGATFTTGDVIGVALDMDAGTLVFYKNNSSQGTAFTGLSNPSFVPAVSNFNSGVIDINFGQRPFAYTPPTGFVRLNTFNLPTPTIGATASSQANKYFNATTYTGNGAASSNTTQNITTTFYPDLTWVKGRDSAFFHRLTSTGLTQPNYLSTNSTDAEGSVNDTISALASTYFQVKAAGTGGTNQSGSTYVGWTWNANSGSTVSNNSGSITSTVSANTTAGFSVVTYTGTGANATVGHGLGVAPKMIIIKNRGDVSDWAVWHTGLSGNSYYIYLNKTSAQSNVNAMWNNTAPTSTVFSLGTSTDSNDTKAMVAYCFAQVAGYSAFGSYTGNGSSDGTFVFTGFRPKFVMVKCSSNSTSSTVWSIFDTSRSPYNAAVLELYPNLSSAEGTDSNGMDILSNGFKPKRNSEYLNFSGWTYIYACFAEFPFKFSNAR